jgi:hypothetical protein
MGRQERAKLSRFPDEYREANLGARPFSSAGVLAIVIKDADGTEHRFNKVNPSSDPADVQYVDERGWVIEENKYGPNGEPYVSRWGRFLVNLFLNFFHLVLWFLCLWLLLRFQWPHALGFAVVMWLIVTLSILPMMLSQAGEIALQGRAAL